MKEDITKKCFVRTVMKEDVTKKYFVRAVTKGDITTITKKALCKDCYERGCHEESVL